MHDFPPIYGYHDEPMTELARIIYRDNVARGWWDESTRHGGVITDKYMIPTKIALMHSELSEALEGQRKGLQDDHLPQHTMEAVEYADTIIRILDACGHMGYDIGQIVLDKLAYNATRPDHKREARQAPGGKAV